MNDVWMIGLLLVASPLAATEFDVVVTADIEWQQLNPARGDRSPQAGTLWGDRHGAVATGFLAKFVDGFSSPPHIHNATYRAVVIRGLIHNDDPDAADMWMPVGSFWTQPKGEVHITSASGDVSIALVEIDEGPYLVLPPENAFDSGERPVNVDAANIVWVDPAGGPPSPRGANVAYLWGRLDNGASNGTFVRLPAGFDGDIRTEAETFRAVVVTGHPTHVGSDSNALAPGSYVGSNGPAIHRWSTDDEAVLYVRTNGPYDIATR